MKTYGIGANVPNRFITTSSPRLDSVTMMMLPLQISAPYYKRCAGKIRSSKIQHSLPSTHIMAVAALVDVDALFSLFLLTLSPVPQLTSMETSRNKIFLFVLTDSSSHLSSVARSGRVDIGWVLPASLIAFDELV